MTAGDLAERLAALEAREAIAALKARYAELCDSGYSPDALALLFAEDGIWEGGLHRVRLVGRAAIGDYFSGMAGKIQFARHLMVNAIIDVSGDRATGRWDMLLPMAVTEGDTVRPRWQLSTYHESYRRVAGCWLFAHLAAAPSYLDPDCDLWKDYGA
ncbi:MAG: nuclear transport factor 2 family protein [Alphaproteobacteria bacterium]|nr:nuclear transport factor 2 family protein [Alphaproteobacteria bacterium]